MSEKIIHLRNADGDEQRLTGKHAARVAESWEARGYKQFEPEPPYDPAAAAKSTASTAGDDEAKREARRQRDRERRAQIAAEKQAAAEQAAIDAARVPEVVG